MLCSQVPQAEAEEQQEEVHQPEDVARLKTEIDKLKKQIEDTHLFYNTMPGLDDHIEELEEEYDYNDDDGWVKKDGEKVIHST